MWADPGRRRWPLWLAIAAAHLGLAALLRPQFVPLPAARQEMTVRLLALPRAAPAPSPTARPLPRPTTRPRPVPPMPAAPASPPPPPTTASIEPPPPPASAPPEPLLINTEATRRALRMMAREPLLSERTQLASGLAPRETREQRLAREMHQAGYGDCTKGEFPGGGMGLLSLPFYLVAQARGTCAK